jgi:hypothetical protein
MLRRERRIKISLKLHLSLKLFSETVLEMIKILYLYQE